MQQTLLQLYLAHLLEVLLWLFGGPDEPLVRRLLLEPVRGGRNDDGQRRVVGVFVEESSTEGEFRVVLQAAELLDVRLLEHF